MRQTAIMDFLSDGRGQGGGWVPTSERVLQAGELTGESDAVEAATASLTQFVSPPGVTDSLPSVPAFDQFSARRSAMGPVVTQERPPTTAPTLTPDDLAALEELTNAELVQARGTAPAPASSPAPPIAPPTAAPSTPAPPRIRPRPVPAPAPPSTPARDILPTWPPGGHVVPAWQYQAPNRRPGSGFRPGRILAVLVLLALAGGVAWYFLLRPQPRPAPSAWDPRVSSTVAFVSHVERLSWKHPVSVVFLSRSGFQQKFRASIAAAGSRPEPAGIDVVQYVPSSRVVYVLGTSLDYYGRYALAGQLTEALRAQYPASASTAFVRAQAVRVQATFLSGLSADQIQSFLAEQARHI